MWFQHITVLEPDDDMIECAIRAFLAVIPDEEIEEERAKIAAETPAEETAETAEASIEEPNGSETKNEDTPQSDA